MFSLFSTKRGVFSFGNWIVKRGLFVCLFLLTGCPCFVVHWIEPFFWGGGDKVTALCDAPLAAAGLFVVSEAMKKHRKLR